MADKIVVVYQVQGRLEAELIKSYLEAYEVPAGLAQESAGMTYGLTFGALGEVDILVPAEYETQAKELLEEYEKGSTAPLDETSE